MFNVLPFPVKKVLYTIFQTVSIQYLRLFYGYTPTILVKYRCNMGIVKNLNPVTVQSKE